MSTTLSKDYKERIMPALVKEFGYTTVMQVPKLEKIVINQGLGDATQDKKLIETSINELTAITGQKAVPTLSRKDISNFKLRKKMPIGVMVTLRRDRMYEFLERLIRVALPRIRDFKGINAKLDGRGNYTLGITEQIIFPEINIDSVSKLNGMNITFVTSAKTDEEGFALLKQFGLPFKTEKCRRQHRLRGSDQTSEVAQERFSRAPAQPLLHHRPSERLYAPVRYLSYTIPRDGQRRPYPRC